MMSEPNILKLDKLRLLIEIVAQYVRQSSLVPPLSMNELRQHTASIIQANNFDTKDNDLIAILINNEAWKDTLAKIPYEKRLLLLPQCLKHSSECKADFDELGLICNHCGKCIISGITDQAEQLGYSVLVAEGSPVVMKLIETGQIEAVIGVSCLAVLERTFPYMEAGAIPGIAIPLLCDGCVDTKLDTEWLIDSLYLNSTDQVGRIDLNAIKDKVNSSFTTSEIKSIFGNAQSKTESIAIDWLLCDGKRWRPFLTSSCYAAISENDIADDSWPILRNAGIAVECFHKASLIHDDIEDDDDIRYGQKTIHTEHGIPIAVNVGDYLLGLGYKLIADLPVNPDKIAAMLKVASRGHTDLCLGQGKELVWMRDKAALTVDDVIDIFTKKTSPAFTVALKFGAILSGANQDTLDVLQQYSDALGIAYQIRDDIADFNSGNEDGLSLIDVLTQKTDSDTALKTAYSMLADYKHTAIDSLAGLQNTTLKGLLRRVITKIFDDTKKMECCDDYKTKFDTLSEGSKTNSG